MNFPLVMRGEHSTALIAGEVGVVGVHGQMFLIVLVASKAFVTERTRVGEDAIVGVEVFSQAVSCADPLVTQMAGEVTVPRGFVLYCLCRHGKHLEKRNIEECQ